eukprot:3303423-Pleurochrysis_carterae.AAC.1
MHRPVLISSAFACALPLVVSLGMPRAAVVTHATPGRASAGAGLASGSHDLRARVCGNARPPARVRAWAHAVATAAQQQFAASMPGLGARRGRAR